MEHSAKTSNPVRTAITKALTEHEEQMERAKRAACEELAKQLNLVARGEVRYEVVGKFVQPANSPFLMLQCGKSGDGQISVLLRRDGSQRTRVRRHYIGKTRFQKTHRAVKNILAAETESALTVVGHGG